jgi:hypothetical protein
MDFYKFISCYCGKKIKVSWVGKADFNKGKVTFCIGITKCHRCEIRKEHYFGNVDDIQEFIDYRNETFN